MQLSPKARTLLTAIAGVLVALSGVAALTTALPAVVFAVVVPTILVVFTSLGIVPPQTGGVQEGVTAPSVLGTLEHPASVDSTSPQARR